MLRTNSKKYLNNIQTYLINAIDSDGYENQPTTDKAKVSFLVDCYNSEYNHAYNVKMYPNEQIRFANWLSGLPSVLNIPFYPSSILELAKELQEVETYDQKTKDKICDNYFNFMAYHILKLNQKLNQ
mgnify:CR=1 FL=1|tara:strand:+ start:34 stop:414 length:381 start_codon:yes stop_codon:yes gene_type:complete